MALSKTNSPSKEGEENKPQETPEELEARLKLEAEQNKDSDSSKNDEDENKDKEKDKSKDKEPKAPNKSQKQDSKVTLRHPTSQTNGTIGLYLPTGEEMSVQIKNGIVTLEHSQYDVRDVLIKDGYIDRTVYSEHKEEIVIKEPEKKLIKKAKFFHPNASDDVPMNGTIGLYRNDGSEVKVEVVKNVIETTDQEIYEILISQNFPTGPVEYLENK
ncbi:hypothetical protein [Leptospira phage LE4]|uniref:Uncharacterized protein n=1 Tax=Leptospira phage LE4 TaxID=2041383 RepID=A0A343LEC9_9CAUD|nr:hypothetical protein HWB34_gp26 [Leptospira phage LE4]ATN95039.1 hypothetical protein [Leptospira phage LE4]